MENDILVFFDCADEIRKTVSPENVSGFKYIGLEHIEQDTLHLNGYGAVEDVSSAKALFSKGDILFGKLRPYFRKVVRAPFDGVCSTDIWVVRAKNGIDQGFLYYWMASQEFVNFSMQGSEGTKMPRAKWEHVGKHVIPFFDESEQRAIAYILSILDDKIELNRQMNKTLESIAQALFKSWFVDFDPVRAKMEGREPEGMDADTAALFPDSFEESELGLMPRGWRVTSIYDVAKVTYGAPFSSKLFKSEPPGRPLVRIRDLKDERPGVYTEEIHTKGYLIQPGDIVVGMDGEFRAYVWGGEEAWLNQRVCCIHPVNGACNAFIRLCISPLLTAVEVTETATTVIHLGKNDIDRFKIILSTPNILEAFSKIAVPLYERLVTNKQQVQNLANLRDTLLPRLISGQLRLPEAEAAMEAVLA